MASWMTRFHAEEAKLAQHDGDPLLRLVAEAVAPFDSVSSNAILTMVGLPVTAANARKVARSMRTLGFVPIKSNRLVPGGYRQNVTRGWARPLRAVKISASVNTLPASPASPNEGE